MSIPVNEWLLAATLATSLLLALILLLRRPLAAALGARAVYLLWVAVPAQVVVSIPWLNQASPVRIALPAIISTPGGSGITATASPTALIDGLSMLWLTGTLVLLIRLAIQAVQAARLVSTGAPWKPSANTPLPTLGFQRIRLSHEVGAPVVAGFWKPAILLPADIEHRLDASALRLVLRHETCHALRRDNLANLLAGALLAVFWFNPLAWSAYRAFRADQELSCDAHALGTADNAQRARYGRALLDLAAPTETGPLTTSWHLQHSTRRRIIMLKQHHHSRLRSMAGTFLVCAMTALSIAVAPATGAAPSATDASNDESATPLVRINPGYPIKAVERKLEGHVTMEFTVTENGEVADIVVVNSAPGTTFDEAAVEALARWRFAPEVEEGVAVPRRATQTIEFRLD